MKKISAKKYAIVLHEVTKDLTKEEATEAVANFIKILIRNRQLKIAKKVIAEYTAYSNLQEGIVEAEITVAHALSPAALEDFKKQIKKMQSAKHVEIKEKIDKNLLGGFIVKIGDTVLNASIANQLFLLKQSLVR